jgi:hypothetical protein
MIERKPRAARRARPELEISVSNAMFAPNAVTTLVVPVEPDCAVRGFALHPQLVGYGLRVTGMSMSGTTVVLTIANTREGNVRYAGVVGVMQI